MINPETAKLHLTEYGGKLQGMYTIGILVITIAVAVLAGAIFFLISMVIVVLRAGAEAVANAATARARKLATSVGALRHPKIPAVNTVYDPTFRK
jgi:hypothetical protein